MPPDHQKMGELGFPRWDVRPMVKSGHGVILYQQEQVMRRCEMSDGVFTLVSLFVVRVFLPVVITLGLGTLLSRWDARRDIA
jgi:hypothetical protein